MTDAPAHRARHRTPSLTAALAAVLAIGLGLAGCSGDDGTEGSTKVAPPVSATSTSTTTTTTAPTTTTLPPPTGAGSPSDAAGTLYGAWKANDKVTAAKVATPEAVAGMFATAPGDYSLYNHCDTGEFGTSGCLYRSPATYATIQFNMEQRNGAWVVIEALYMPR